MTISPKRHAEQMKTLVQVWTALNPAKSFSGLSLEEVRMGFQDSLAARTRVSNAEAELSTAIALRDAADETSWELYKRAINAIKADADRHDRAEMYKALGIQERKPRRRTVYRAPEGAAPNPNQASAAGTAPVPQSLLKPAA